MLSVRELLSQPPQAPDHRIPYGSAPSQFGDLYLPSGNGPVPVVILIHGGCWQAAYDLVHISPLAGAIRDLGTAVWSLEYRRVGEPGGGWPGTFLDVAAGADMLPSLAARFQLDMGCTVAAGHSAGGHLALWLAGRSRIPEDNPIYSRPAVKLTGVLGLAPIPDLELALEQAVCDDAVAGLLGTDRRVRALRARAASPLNLLPLGLPQHVIVGQADPIVPPAYLEPYREAATQGGDRLAYDVLPNCGHYEPIVPGSGAWDSVRTAILGLLTNCAP